MHKFLSFIFLKLILTSVIVFLTFNVVFAGNSQPLPFKSLEVKDYPEYPLRDIDYKKASIRLHLDEVKNVIQGTVVYEFNLFRNDVHEIVMNAFRMQINSARVNGQNVDFTMHNDSLFIPLSSNIDESKSVQQVEITYDTDLKFGFYNSSEKVWFTSTEPYAVAHYLPGFIHPRNKMNTEIEFNLPNGYEFAGPGEMKNQMDTQKNRITYHCSTIQPISITDLTFAFGELEKEEIRYGVKKLNLYNAKNALTKTVKNELLEQVYSSLKETEQQLNREYPFTTFSLIVLNENVWNSKAYGASTGFLFQNFSNWDLQIERLVQSQWFGVDKQGVNRKTALFDVYWQAWLTANRMSKTSFEKITILNSPFCTNSPYSWNTYAEMVNRFQLVENEFWFNAFSKTVEKLVQSDKKILLSGDYQEWLYSRSGQIFDSLLTHQELISVPNKASINIDFDGISKLNLSLNAQFSLQQLLDAEVVLVTPQKKTTKTIAFSTAKETVSLKVPATLSNVYVNMASQNWILETQKPMEFWLYQLRNETSDYQRVIAAKALVSDTTNPDLQLIINDLLKMEKTPELRAELLELYGNLTKGATGTDQLFLDSYLKGEPVEKMAALRSFIHFPANEQMISIAQRLLKSNSDTTFKYQAILSLSALMTSESFFTFATDFIRSGRDEYSSLKLLHQLNEKGFKSENVSFLTDLIMNRYSFSIRYAALEILMNSKDNQTEIKQWESLFSDNDPRIRYAMLNFLSRFSTEQIGQILDERINLEYDFRIIAKLNSLASQYLAGN